MRDFAARQGSSNGSEGIDCWDRVGGTFSFVADPLEVVEVTVEVTFPLRRRVLRSDRVDLDLRMPDDAVDGAFHLAVFGADGEAVGVATAMPAEPPFDAEPPAWRIRQMAVDPAVQGTGIGAALFDAVVQHIRERRGATVWAESRDSSVGFYLARGMSVVAGRAHRAGGVDYTDVVMRLGRSEDRQPL
jgi:GNAT superfamily N-acetyltransferase